MARDKEEGAGFDPLGWMLTFSDLVTLLLTFFVMLLAMKQPEVTKLKAVFGMFSGGASSMSLTDQTKAGEVQRLLESIRQPMAEEFLSPEQELARELDAPQATGAVMESSLQKGLRLHKDERGVVITLANDLIFAPGSAELTPESIKSIKQAAELIRYGHQQVAVEGHTDSTAPRPGATIRDNFTLSLLRALAVLRQLINVEKISPERLRVGAMGDTRPLVANDTPEHRAMNRRTEIVLLMPKP